MKVTSFDETVKELGEINGKSVRDVLNTIENIASKYKPNRTEFVRQLFLNFKFLYPYAIFVLKNYYGAKITYPSVRRLFRVLKELNLIIDTGKYVKGKGRFHKHLFSINPNKVDAPEWQNPLKYWYQMHRWKSYELRNIRYRRHR